MGISADKKWGANSCGIGRVFISSLFGVALCAVGTVQAAEDWINPGDERFKLLLGVFLPSFDSTMRIDDTATDIGTEIDMENDLGLKSQETIAWGGFEWRIASRHRLSLAHFSFSRDATATALRNLEIENEIIEAGASMTTEFNMGVTPLAYSYSFIKKEQHELAGSLGLHWNDIEFALAATASATGAGATETADGKVSAKAVAPMPLIGIRYDYFPTSRWGVGVHAQFFDISISDDTFSFDGSITNFRVSGEYWLINNLALGLAVNYFNLNVDIKDDEWRGSADYEYVGPQLYVTARF